jgi:hypothetical protein
MQPRSRSYAGTPAADQGAQSQARLGEHRWTRGSSYYHGHNPEGPQLPSEPAETGRPLLSALPEGECSPRAQPSPSRAGPSHRIRVLPRDHPCRTPHSGPPALHCESRHRTGPRFPGGLGAGGGVVGSYMPATVSCCPCASRHWPIGRRAPRACAAHGVTFAAAPQARTSAQPTLVGVGQPPPAPA